MYVPQQNVILIAKHAHQLAPARRATLAIGFYKILARLQYARQIASKILDEDPFLEKAENTILAQHIQNQKKEVVDWGTIS